MSSSRRDVLLTIGCTLLLALPLQAAKPNDPGPNYPAGYTESPAEIGGKSFAQWMTELTNPDPSVRSEAIMVMPYFRQRGEEAIPKLASIRRWTAMPAHAQGGAGHQHDGCSRRGSRPRGQGAGPLRLADPQTIIRYEAAKALLRFGPDSRTIIIDLVMGMGNNSTFEVREACIMVLREAGVDPAKGPDPRVTDALIARLIRTPSQPARSVCKRSSPSAEWAGPRIPVNTLS